MKLSVCKKNETIKCDLNELNFFFFLLQFLFDLSPRSRKTLIHPFVLLVK